MEGEEGQRKQDRTHPGQCFRGWPGWYTIGTSVSDRDTGEGRRGLCALAERMEKLRHRENTWSRDTAEATVLVGTLPSKGWGGGQDPLGFHPGRKAGEGGPLRHSHCCAVSPQPDVHQGEAGADTERPRGSPCDLQTDAAAVADPVQLLPAGVSGGSLQMELGGGGCQGNSTQLSAHDAWWVEVVRMFE